MRYIFEKFALGLCCIAGAVLLFLLIQHLAHHSAQMALKKQGPEKVRIEKEKEAKNAKDDRKIHVQKAILGSTKAEVIEMFKGWKRSYTYESKIDPNAIKFENKDLIAVIDFDKEKRAEGVSFLSISGLDDRTGKKSYVNKNYEKLLHWATDGKGTKIDCNKSTQYPVEVYIGNIHED